jgi:hypothetical protein
MPNYIIDDGDYSKARQVGTASIVHPFIEEGDNETTEVSAKFQVWSRYYKRPKLMQKTAINSLQSVVGIRTTTGPISATINTPLYLVGQTQATDIGNGILEYEMVFSTIPATRTVYSTTNYTFQYPNADLSGLIEVTDTVPCVIKYEYGLKPFASINAPKAVSVGGGDYITYGGWGNMVAGKAYLAEDSEVGQYKARIYFRKSVFITWKALSLRN